MGLHEPSVQRLRASEGLMGGEKLVEMFELLAADAGLNSEHSSCIVVHWLDENDKFITGTYTPEIHFVVRRIEPDDEVE